MTELSSQAQAVLDAANGAQSYGPGDCLNESRWIAAAAIEALADQVVSPVPPPCEDFDEYAQGFLAAHVKYRSKLLAIAAELEAQ